MSEPRPHAPPRDAAYPAWPGPASTRRRIVDLLRRAGYTVDELAGTLGLTDNAVRAQLTALERDGLVRAADRRRGPRKPAVVYALTPEAERLFPKAYDVLLRLLLEALTERLPRRALKGVLADVAGRLAARATAGRDRAGTLEQRLEAATAVLHDLGGLVEVEGRGDAYVLRGYSCPLAAVAAERPEACRFAAALLTNIIGAQAEERCERSGSPRCAFWVTRPAGA